MNSIYQKGNYFPPVSFTPWNKLSKNRKLKVIEEQGEREAEQVRIFTIIQHKHNERASTKTIYFDKITGRKKGNNSDKRPYTNRGINSTGLFGESNDFL